MRVGETLELLVLVMMTFGVMLEMIRLMVVLEVIISSLVLETTLLMVVKMEPINGLVKQYLI